MGMGTHPKPAKNGRAGKEQAQKPPVKGGRGMLMPSGSNATGKASLDGRLLKARTALCATIGKGTQSKRGPGPDTLGVGGRIGAGTSMGMGGSATARGTSVKGAVR